MLHDDHDDDHDDPRPVLGQVRVDVHRRVGLVADLVGVRRGLRLPGPDLLPLVEHLYDHAVCESEQESDPGELRPLHDHDAGVFDLLVLLLSGGRVHLEQDEQLLADYERHERVLLPGPAVDPADRVQLTHL